MAERVDRIAVTIEETVDFVGGGLLSNFEFVPVMPDDAELVRALLAKQKALIVAEIKADGPADIFPTSKG